MDVTLARPDTTDLDEEVPNQRQLSDNILVIEISGPEVHNLSVVDFPGFNQSTSHDFSYQYWL